MQWRDVPGFEGLYQVSTEGQIRNYNTWRVLRPRMARDGSLLVNLSAFGEHKTHILHRLVAKVFVRQPDGKPYIKHKDGNKLNNASDNLYWTHSKRPTKRFVS